MDDETKHEPATAHTCGRKRDDHWGFAASYHCAQCRKQALVHGRTAEEIADFEIEWRREIERTLRGHQTACELAMGLATPTEVTPMSRKVQLYVEMETPDMKACAFLELTLPFVPAKGQTLSFANASHPTCTIDEVDYYVDRDEWMVGAKMAPSNKAHLLWTLVRLVGGSKFVIVEIEGEHPLLNEDTLVEHEWGSGSGLTFAPDCMDDLLRAFVLEWTGRDVQPGPRLLVTKTSRPDT